MRKGKEKADLHAMDVLSMRRYPSRSHRVADTGKWIAHPTVPRAVFTKHRLFT